MNAVAARFLRQVTRIAFGVAILVLLLSANILYRNTQELYESSSWVEHTQQVLLTQQQLMTQLSEAESAQRTFLLEQVKTDPLEYGASKGEAQRRLNELAAMIEDNPEQVARINQLREKVQLRLAQLDENQRLGRDKWSQALFTRGVETTNQIREVTRQIAAAEGELLAERKRQHAANYRYSRVTIGLSTAVALVTVGLGFYFIHRDAEGRRRLALEQEAAAAQQKKAAEFREAAAAEQERLARYNTLILNSTGEGIVGVGPDGRVTFANAAAGNLLGIVPDEAVGRGLIELVHPLPEDADGDEAMPKVEDFPPTRTAITGDPARGADFAFRRGNGTRFPVEYSSYPIEYQGTVAGAVVAFSDVTTRKLQEKEIQEAAVRAEQANLAKSQFLANMSHELRTPLNAVILYSELLQEESEDRGIDDFGPDLEKIRSAGKHLLSLVNGVLDLSKIEAGKMDLYLEDFDVREMLDDVLGTIAPLIEKKHNAMELKVPGTLGTVHGDLTKTRQILFNFLSNAAKFTENGIVTLAVDRMQRHGREVISYTVKDSGIGMTDEQMGKLFQPFTQADESTTRKYGGTGLGLTICKRFAELMGGDITVTSVPNEGTTFQIQVPTTVGVKAQEVAQPEPVSAIPLSVPRDGAVLVIDDNPEARKFIVEALAKEGMSAVTASDGEEGLKIAKQFRPAAIFLDVIMPRLDGWGVLAELKKDAKLADVPVIMLTVAAGKDMGYTLGAAEYLTKPVDGEDLTAVIRKYCEADTDTAVLVVDDDDTTRHAVRRALTRAGFVVDDAVNGADALEKTRVKPYALIILDLVMPVMDGFAFVREFRKTPQGNQTPIVIVTSKDLTPGDRKQLTGQVEAVMQKGGYSLEELQAEIHRFAVKAGAGGAEAAENAV